MQVADKDAIDFMNWNLKLGQLHLRPLSAIDEEVAILNHQIMTGRKSSESR